ncbi:MATH and LRR domain-containing protein [Senna tora]|uniref:MATH and LRR domain-containing protein n=1 Tax=Senna tora TaxID=362788 RepID=A0A834TQ70_9FABA|nr:MATH and LRR domain-containing protein [Senna tora]
MPLYDCMFLFKPHLKKEALMDLIVRVGKHVYRRNGVLTDVKSMGEVQLGYGIKKLDGSADANDHDGYTQHQQGATLPKQGRPAASLASG